MKAVDFYVKCKNCGQEINDASLEQAIKTKQPIRCKKCNAIIFYKKGTIKQ